MIKTEYAPRNRFASLGRKNGTSGIRALVIEDDAEMSELIGDVLSEAEIEPVTFVSRSEAFSRFGREKFDVILVDVNLDSKSGGILVREARSSSFNRQTPIILISDDQRPAALTEAFEAGASFFVYKPLNRAHLTRLIRVAHGTIENTMRRFRRVPVRVRISIQCGESVAEAETINLSLNGALVKSRSKFVVHSKVGVSIYLLPGADPVIGKGTVARVGEREEFGIRFDGLSVADSRRLQDYLLPLLFVATD